jgi:hypothetical protein
MKTSIFDMNFVLPPLVYKTLVEKEEPDKLPRASFLTLQCSSQPHRCNWT